MSNADIGDTMMGWYRTVREWLPPNELRLHVARSRHISLVERGRSAPRQLLYLEFNGEALAGQVRGMGAGLAGHRG